MAFEYNKEEWMRHAKFELSFISENPEVVEFYLKIMEIFTDYQHSDKTLFYMPITLSQLFKHENVLGLTEHPNEWVEISEGLLRNKRNPKMYSNDGGVTCIKFPEFEQNYANNNIKPTNLPPLLEKLFEELGEIDNIS